MADGEAECNLAERHSGRQSLRQSGGAALVAAEEVEGEESGGERVPAWLLPRQSAAGEDANGKDADSQLFARGQQVAEIRFGEIGRHLAPRAGIEQVVGG